MDNKIEVEVIQSRRYGVVPYAAICGFDLFLKWRFMDLAPKIKICDSRCQINHSRSRR